MLYATCGGEPDEFPPAEQEGGRGRAGHKELILNEEEMNFEDLVEVEDNKEPDNDEEENSQILPPEQFGVKYNNEKFVQLKFCKGYQDQNYEIEITNEETQVKQYFGPYPGKGEDKMTLVTVHGLQPGLIVRGRVYVEGNPSLSSNSVDFKVRCASLLR